MVAIGTRINEIDTLIRAGGAFYLRRDVGGATSWNCIAPS